MKTAVSSEMLITICQTTRVQILEIHNPVRPIMLRLLDSLIVTANKDNYKSLGTKQHCQGRPRTIPLP